MPDEKERINAKREEIKKSLEEGAPAANPTDPNAANPFTEGDPEQVDPADKEEKEE